jgi:nucleoside 2-deoxyribosyltransferase
VKQKRKQPKHIYDFYFAAPFFNPEQIGRERRLVELIRGYGYVVYAPSEHGILKPDASESERRKTFFDNVKAIKRSNYVFAVTDGKDMGTIWEAGFAYGKGKPIIYYAETLTGPFNVMLGESGIGVFTDMDNLKRALFYENFEYKSTSIEGVQ